MGMHILRIMDDMVPRRGDPLILGQKTETYEIVAGRADAGVIVLCDHATNMLPDAYGSLGLETDQLSRHIAYDIGSEGVTRALASALGAPAIMTKYSRLLIDPNRGEDDPTLVMRISDGAVVPGNRHLSVEERQMRISRYYRPYHAAIDDMIDQCLGVHVTPTLLSIHSFTEVWRRKMRPWHIGILFGQDERLAQPLLEVLRKEGDLVVGENEPYPGQMEGDCMWQHGTGRGVPHAIVELRQDLIASPEGQNEWAARLVDVLGRMPATEDLTFTLTEAA